MFAELTVQGIRDGLRPEQAAYAAAKTMGAKAMRAWILAHGLRPPQTHARLERMAKTGLDFLASQREAWQRIQGHEVSVGDFITVDEDALICVTGYDADGHLNVGPHEMNWLGVIEDGIRVDKLDRWLHYSRDALQVKTCPTCGHAEDETGFTVHADQPLLRLRALGGHQIR